MNKQATKRNGILLLAEQYGIQANQIVAFGDDYNDMEMLQSMMEWQSGWRKGA